MRFFVLRDCFWMAAVYKPISEYGLIGNMYTSALVGMDGAIDWLPAPYFDSPSVFAAILDGERGGYFKICLREDCRRQQFYYPDTNALITRFLHGDGVGEVQDFMPLNERESEGKPLHQIYRLVKCVRGKIDLRMECFPVFDYARKQPMVHCTKQGVVFENGQQRMALQADVPMKAEGGGAVSSFTMHQGESCVFVLHYHLEKEDGNPLEYKLDAKKTLERTLEYWYRWLSRCNYRGRWREMVMRSALTLKLLTFEPTGAMVAAPTTSLPESIGGDRNWDYRFTWLRDASFSVYALMRLGFLDEATRFMDFVFEHIVNPREDGHLQIMYTIHGKKKMPEKELEHLSGYQNSRPVRVGNLAVSQLQLDVYGELLDAIYLYNKHGKMISYKHWIGVEQLANWVSENWQQKDQGLWEQRSKPRHFVYSKVMCWVALDRAIRIAKKRSFPGKIEYWRAQRDNIYRQVMQKGWDKKLSSFVQYYGSSSLDASNLIMPLVLFLAPTDPRMEATLNNIIEHLVSDSLVFRYLNFDDGLQSEEGTFSLCSFWLVEALTRAGRLKEARIVFEKILSYANHLGLYSEEISSTGELLGNFPQAFSHFSLISAATNLDRALDKIS